MGMRRNLIGISLATVAAAAVGWFLIPKIGELGHTWAKVSSGRPGWLLAAVGLEVISFIGYVVLFRAVFVRSGSRIDWRESYQITMAGLAATRLLAAGGAGGVALTAWALKRSGMDGHTVTRRMTAFMVILYSVYMAALLVFGLGLWIGIFSGSAPLALTLIPAAFGALVIGGALLVSRARPVSAAPADGPARGLRARARGSASPWPPACAARRPAAFPRGGPAGRGHLVGLRHRRPVGCFHAFGAVPPLA